MSLTESSEQNLMILGSANYNFSFSLVDVDLPFPSFEVGPKPKKQVVKLAQQVPREAPSLFTRSSDRIKLKRVQPTSQALPQTEGSFEEDDLTEPSPPKKVKSLLVFCFKILIYFCSYCYVFSPFPLFLGCCSLGHKIKISNPSSLAKIRDSSVLGKF